MDFEFVRHEPLYDRVLLVLTLDRQKMKERILRRRTANPVSFTGI